VIRAIDLTRPLSCKSLSYPGKRPGLEMRRVDIGDPRCQVSELTRLDPHLGTHIDAPLHFVPGATDVAELGMLMLPAVLVETTESLIGPEHIPEAVEGCAVLFSTGWTRMVNEPGYFEGYSTLTPEAARVLVERGVALVGVDMPSADTVSMVSGFPIHHTLLGAGIPIVEGLTGLDQLRGMEAERIWFGAFPPPIAGIEGAPIRAVAFVLDAADPEEASS